MNEPSYTLLAGDDSAENISIQELKNQLEKGDDETKISTVKKIIIAMLNGDPLPQLLMFVIRFVVPSKNKTLKKLLLIYWEIAQKKNPDGKLKQEFILVCNALRNDLQHPNEFIRGSTLRFLCKLKEAEILEPLVPSIRSCLEHRHSYVRRNAVLAIYMIYKQYEYLIPDAPELISNFMNGESDMSCKRNAFIMLYNCDQNRAVDYLSNFIQQVPNFGDNLQLVVVELIRKVCKTNPAEKAKYFRCIYELLNSSSNAVKYESASALVSLTSAPTALKSAASCYINLVLKESDNNVKLIVLDRFNELRERNPRVLDDLVMDLLRILVSPDIEVKKKCLDIAMELTSSRNVADIVAFLKKEITKTHDQDYEKNTEYRQHLIQTIHQCAIKYPEVAANVIHTLMEFIGDSNPDSAADVVVFVKEVVEKFPALRQSITQRLLESFSDMRDARVFRGALWVIGEYCIDVETIDQAYVTLQSVLGEVPIVASELREAEALAERMLQESSSVPAPALSAPTTRVTVLPDGTYSTQSALSIKETALTAQIRTSKKTKPLRSLLLEGEYFLSSSLAVTLTKLALRYATLSKDQSKANSYTALSMLIITSVLRLGKSELPPQPIDPDNYERISICLRALAEPKPLTNDNFLVVCRQTFAALLDSRKSSESGKGLADGKKVSQADELISFRQLRGKKANADDFADQYDLDLTKATGSGENNELLSKLNRIVQLTGHSDPVYAEAYVNVHQYDILLDVLVVNQTGDTLQNLTLELATLGDLKLVERPSTHTLGAHDFLNIKANIKVSSTETGVIFGNLVYDTTGAAETHVVVLNDIHIDIMDYINPTTCSDQQFRQMWQEFEWENKLNVNTTITDLRTYMDHIIKQTNMSSLTPKSVLEGDCDFLAANLYARSIFGEDALANVCIEKTSSGSIVGHIRIRSKTQGLALSLGDKITLCQRALPEQQI